MSESAPAILPGSNDLEKLHALCNLTYKQQAVWFLNAFWEDNNLETDAESLWNYVGKCADLDVQKHEEGSGLDEMKAHVFLESFKETLTVRELRAKLRSTGAIGEKERPKVVPLTHYLLFKYNVDWHSLVHASQGDNSKEIAEAQKLLDEVSAAFVESEKAHSEATKALLDAQAKANEAAKQESEAKASAEQAKLREAESKVSAEVAAAKEVESKAAQSELEVALAEVQKQEDAYNAKTESLKKKSEEGGVVSRNKAKNELAQHLGEDPLPLRKAKITLEAAVKKAERATKAASAAKTKADADAVQATEARATAERDAQEAEAARKAAEESAAVAAEKKAEAEQKLVEARQKVQQAELFLDQVKQKPGSAHGAIWWMERELYEQKKYLPESKGGIRK